MEKGPNRNQGGSNAERNRETDLFGNPIKEEPEKDTPRPISPQMEKYRGAMEGFTLEELQRIYASLGFESKKHQKKALVSAILGFFSSLEGEDFFKKWFASLPPYLSEAIQQTCFGGYIDAKKVEKAAGKPVLGKKTYYFLDDYQLNPNLRLAFFFLYINRNLKLLFMKPLFRRLFIPLLPAPPDLPLGPQAEQELTGWSNMDSLSESMPLLLKSMDRLFLDRDIYQTILRRGLNKGHIKELRKSSAFPQFPRTAESGIDPIDLIARFILIDPELSFTSQQKDVMDYLKDRLKSFFVVPPSGKVKSYYNMVDSSFEFSVLCPHLSRKPGAPRYENMFHPHPQSRTTFYQILTSMAKTGGWYNVDDMARSLQKQGLPDSIFWDDRDASEIILKGEALKLPEGNLVCGDWEKGFEPDVYLKYHLISKPLLKAYCYLMAALGVMEIVEGEPKKLLKKNDLLVPISPFDGLINARITPFGAWCLGCTQEKPEFKQVSYEAIADRELPLITYRGHSLECKVFLERIGDPIGEDRFRVTEASFIRDCTSMEDIEQRIREFHRLVAKEPAQHWEALFSRVKKRSHILDSAEACTMITLPPDPELRRIFLEDKKLSSLAVRAEGGRIVVANKNYAKLLKALEGYGVLQR